MSAGINANLPEGATALSPDDMTGLIPAYIATRGDLNEFEKANIQQALNRIRRQKLGYMDILTVGYCLKLHQQMFNRTWKWAGCFRQREVNIGNTPPHMIATQVRNVLDNVKFWLENDTFPIDEICLRLHRDIVWIHPFPNGNGRHSRIFCDVLRKALGLGFFTWSNHSGGGLVAADQHRQDYLSALREADSGQYARLIQFATSLN